MVSFARTKARISWKVDRLLSNWKKEVFKWSMWISLGPSPEEVMELVCRFLEMAELLKEEVNMEIEGWTAEAVVARSLGWRVSIEVVQ